ncbi:phage/plasmid-associated DNA primase [Kitasatospora sp. GAS204A]|nr:phage/plasmid-associated DNA primase [Kitasatospora sp. GAS204B]
MVHDVSGELLQEAASTGSDALIDAAKALRTSRHISAALLEMQAMPAIRRSVADLDADPYALTFRNGTVDLRSGMLCPHDPADLITRLVELDYRPEAECPSWLGFLESSQPNDPEMHSFLQRLAGYAVPGSTREECLAFFYGSGRNGKGVFTETLGKVFAAVTTAQEAEFWEKQRNGRNGSLVAKLHGARVVLSSEMTAARLDEAFVKLFTAADLLTANQKYKPAYDFTPTALLIMSGNDKPTIRAPTKASGAGSAACRGMSRSSGGRTRGSRAACWPKQRASRRGWSGVLLSGIGTA